MTKTKQKNTPVDTIRDRNIKAVIWGNPKKDGNGIRYSAQLIRSYKDENGNWHDTPYLSETELLRANLLIPSVYQRIGELRAKYYQAQNN